MTKALDRNLIIGLDVGTSKVVAVVGEVTPDNKINIIGVGRQPSRGMDKGGVNDLNLVIESIQRAVDEAQLMGDCDTICGVYLGISGKHIRCQNESGMVAINNTEVTQADLDAVVHAAKSVPMSAERRTLHVLPQDYSVDLQEDIKSPIGMSGVRMEARVHMITCANDMARNIEKCVERCGLKIQGLVFNALASSYSVLTEDEKELGVALIDIGGGTMDIAVYANGALRHSAVLPVAGNQVTGDIAKIFRTPISHAESIKVQFASALRAKASTEDCIEVPSVGGRPARTMSRHTLAEVVEPRCQEIFELALEEISKSGLTEQIAAGIVLTGGAAKLQGAAELAEEVFHMPVRVGKPLGVGGLADYVNDPSYATACGLLLFGLEKQTETDHVEESPSSLKSFFGGLVRMFKAEM